MCRVSLGEQVIEDECLIEMVTVLWHVRLCQARTSRRALPT